MKHYLLPSLVLLALFAVGLVIMRDALAVCRTPVYAAPPGIGVTPSGQTLPITRSTSRCVR